MIGRGLAATGVVALLGLALTGCSGEGDPITAPEAGDQLGELMMLPPADRECLTEQFEGDADAREAVNLAASPSAAQLDALEEVALACLPAESIAATVSQAMTAAFGGDPTAEACVREAVLALSREDQAVFVSGPIAQASFDPTGGAQLPAPAQRVGELTQQLTSACGLSPTGPASTAPPAAAPPDETTVSPTTG